MSAFSMFEAKMTKQNQVPEEAFQKKYIKIFKVEIIFRDDDTFFENRKSFVGP